MRQPAAPLVVVIAGPNGAGKSTTAPHLLRYAFAVGEFVNAEMLAAARESFAFETILASRHFAPWIRKLRGQGFRAHVAFLFLLNADLAVARVEDRVLQGGHNVPEVVDRRRFVRGLSNFFSLYMPVVDSWRLFDNSDIAGHDSLLRVN
jgi:predicted ABC-type ATPase